MPGVLPVLPVFFGNPLIDPVAVFSSGSKSPLVEKFIYLLGCFYILSIEAI